MKIDQTTLWRHIQHKAIHSLVGMLEMLQEGLITYACENDLWRTKDERLAEQPEEESQ